MEDIFKDDDVYIMGVKEEAVVWYRGKDCLRVHKNECSQL